MRKILAIDPGPEASAYVDLAGSRIAGSAKLPCAELLKLLRADTWLPETSLVIEAIASYGMPVGMEVFLTCQWIGRFQEAWESRRGRGPVHLVFRREVKLHHCGQARAKDANVRQAVLDRYGGKGSRHRAESFPGPLYGVSGDVWQALALALTFADRHPRR